MEKDLASGQNISAYYYVRAFVGMNMPLRLTLFFLTASIAALGQPLPMGPARYFAPEKDQFRAAVKRELPSLRTLLPHAIEQVMRPVAQQEVAKAPKLTGLPLAGIHRALPVELSEFGRWDTLADGRRLWRAAVHSPGAAGLRLHFENFDAGAGRMWIHDGKGQIDGPYSGRGVFGDGDFWSETLFGNSVTVEYEPAGNDSDTVPFRLATLSHVFPGYFDVEKTEPGREAALPCHLDSTCYQDWAETARSVARMVFEKDGGSYFCTGTLLNTRNTSRVPYFLTANHCIDTDAVARTVQAFWFYQAGACNGAPPATRDLPRSNGARLLATGDENQGDFTLLRLTDVPNGVYFSGWNPQEVALDTPLIGIHHPAGDYKRISFGARRSSPTVVGLLGPNVGYTVTWAQGHTEGGSSGSGLFLSPGVLVGSLTGGLRAPAGMTKCDFNPDSSFYGRFSSYYPNIRDFLEERTTTVAPPPSTPSGVIALASGAAQNFSIPAVANAALLSTPAYSITVPTGATRLTVRLTTSTAGVDTDLYVRFGAAPVVTGGRVTADHSSEGGTGNESIVIDATSNPALRAGTYFISISLFTTGVVVQGSMVATVETGGGATPPGGGSVQLTSGTPREFNLPAVTGGTIFTGPTSVYSIQVPQGATRLTVRVQTATPNVDVDLFVRFNTSPTLQNQQIVADFRSVLDGGDETVTVTPTTNPALQAGTYFIVLGLFTNGVAARGTVTATVEAGGTPPPTGGGQPVVLTSGAAREFQLPSVTSPLLFNAPGSVYTIQVPPNATRLTIRLQTSTPGADVDLFTTFGRAPEITGGRVSADHSSTGETGDETITITAASSPSLRAGVYHIALVLFTTGTAVRGTITATVEGASTTPPPTGGGPTQLTSNAARQFDLAAVQNPTLFNAQASLFTVQVPAGATQLQVRINTATPNADVDLYVNFNSAPRVADGSVQSDHRSETDGTGNETITITLGATPALRAGTYFIAMAVFTAGTPVRGTITAIVDTPASTPPVTGGRILSSGQPSPFQMAAVQQPTLFGGDSNYRITVPEGATRLQVRVTSTDPSVDVDLYVHQGSPVEVLDGNVVADHSSESETGNETVSITSSSGPSLRPGTYYVALSLYSIGKAASGTITAIVEREVPSVRTGVQLLPGQPRQFGLPSISSPTFYSDSQGFHIEVPAGAPGLTIRLRTVPSNVDVDLFVRYGREPELQDGRIVSDYRSAGDTGDEVVSITPGSTPPLRAGTYFIALANYTLGATAQVTLTAELNASPDAPEVMKESHTLRKTKPVPESHRLADGRSGLREEAR